MSILRRISASILNSRAVMAWHDWTFPAQHPKKTTFAVERPESPAPPEPPRPARPSYLERPSKPPRFAPGMERPRCHHCGAVLPRHLASCLMAQESST